VNGPHTLIAELTHACPLACLYCSNPVEPARATLDTASWLRVLGEAEALGVVQLHLTGGEPLVRKDLEAIVAGARALYLYVHLVTSGVPLTRARLAALRDAGLDAIQLSFQDADGRRAAAIAGVDHHAHKLEVARWARALDLPLTVNTVLHSQNIDQVEAIIVLARALGAHRLELANAQYLGHALAHRDALLPTAAQLARAREIARAATGLEVLFVLPDYHAGVARSCMGGWGSQYLLIAPDGAALPCHAARSLPLAFPSVRDADLATIWRSGAFSAFRGTAWMQPPCTTCARRDEDHAGCRCQAFALTGDPAAPDPACALTPAHDLVRQRRH
jgi:pyrroloquinoline quinone biosynthesis protein E